jgi:regulator of cell morphogenesis and NO signaling
MTMHMRKEELILFPYIKRLVAADKGQLTLEAPHFGTVENPIRMMEEEHDRAGNLMKQIRQLSGDYTPPANACNTYRVTFRKLQEFEEDLHQHVHLENNILFPRAAALEARLRNS